MSHATMVNVMPPQSLLVIDANIAFLTVGINIAGNTNSQFIQKDHCTLGCVSIFFLFVSEVDAAERSRFFFGQSMSNAPSRYYSFQL